MKAVPQTIAIFRLAATPSLRQAESLAQMRPGAARDFATR
jgi:hypothetical protein